MHKNEIEINPTPERRVVYGELVSNNPSVFTFIASRILEHKSDLNRNVNPSLFSEVVHDATELIKNNLPFEVPPGIDTSMTRNYADQLKDVAALRGTTDYKKRDQILISIENRLSTNSLHYTFVTQAVFIMQAVVGKLSEAGNSRPRNN